LVDLFELFEFYFTSCTFVLYWPLQQQQQDRINKNVPRMRTMCSALFLNSLTMILAWKMTAELYS